MTYHGRHRAEDITLDLTVSNLARDRAYRANRARTRYVGHLGITGRHAAPPDGWDQDRPYAASARRLCTEPDHTPGRICQYCRTLEIRLMPITQFLAGALKDTDLKVSYHR